VANFSTLDNIQDKISETIASFQPECIFNTVVSHLYAMDRKDEKTFQ
jgi:hypothetical protein